MISLLREPRLRRFFIAHAQSQLGTGAGYVALVLIAYQRLHSGWGVALVLLADFLPGMLFSAYFGALADRHSRGRIAVTAELLRAAAFVAVALVSSFTATIALALLAGVGTALFRPALGAALPTLVEAEDRSRATALYGALQSLGIMLGPAVCGLLLLFGPASWVLLINGASFVASALLLSGVPLDGERVGPRTTPPAGTTTAQTIKQGISNLVDHPALAALLTIGSTTVLCAAVINVAEPVLAVGPLHAGNSGFSILITCYGIGLVAGTAYAARLGSRIATLRTNFLAGVALAGAAMLGCAAARSLSAAVVPFAVGGFANAMIVGPQIRLFHELVTDGLRGRMFGLRETSECACFVIAFIAAGALLSALGPRSIYLLGGALLLATALTGSIVFKVPEAADAPQVFPAEPIADPKLA